MIALSTSCGSDTDVLCGPGTEEQSGVCIVLVEPGPDCGDGTVQDPSTGECRPFVSCGAGSDLDPMTGECESRTQCGLGTLLDLGSGTCIPEFTCGIGTVEQGGQCVPTVTCGAGTVHDPMTDTCEAVQPCVLGATLNPMTGRCESGLMCAANQLEIAGTCYPQGRGVAAEVDVEESAPDRNDPAFGGTPEPLTLEPIGERVVFTGNIGRPADIDGNGVPDQDRDGWRFDGLAAQVLRIRVLSNGLPQPAFELRGPRGYVRRSRAGFVVDADRFVVLPVDGRYDLVVEPALHLISGVRIGGSLADYIGVIEEVDPGPAMGVAPGIGSTPEIVAGELFDLTDNRIQLQAPARTPVTVTLASLGADVTPVLLAFGADGSLVTNTVFDLAQGGWAATFLSEQDGTTIVLDWLDARGPRDDFAVELVAVALLDAGSLPPDSSSVGPTQDIPAGEIAAFGFTLAQGSVGSFDVNATTSFIGPDLQLLGPRGTELVSYDSDQFFLYAAAGEYVLFVADDDSGDELDVSLDAQLTTPLDLGLLDPQGTATGSLAGGLLAEAGGDEETAWITVTTPIGTMVTAALGAEAGDVDMSIYRTDGTRIRDARALQLGRRVHALNDAGETLLLQLRPHALGVDVRPVLDWRLDVTAEDAPPSLDVEPNETLADAIRLGPVPAAAQGRLVDVGSVADFEDNDKDVYRLTLAAPLQSDQAVAVWVDNTDAQSALTGGSGISVRVLDAGFSPLGSIPGQTGSAPGVIGASTVVHIGPSEGVGPFYVLLTESTVAGSARYVIRTEVVTLAVEAEPNDGQMSADDITGVPEIVGFWHSGADPEDVYRLELQSPVAAGTSLVVALDNLETTATFVLSLRDGTMFNYGVSSGVAPVVQVQPLPPGTYYVHVTGPGAGSPNYRLRVGGGPDLETEPNDTAGSADHLGALGAQPLVIDAVGNDAATNGPDVFTFDVATDQSFEAQVLNLDDSARLALTLFDGPDPDSDLQLAFDDDPSAVVVQRAAASGTLSVRVDSRTVGPDRYRLRILPSGDAEQEPNDLQGNGDDLGGLPATRRGIIDRNDTDVYVVTLPSDLAFDRVLRITAHNHSGAADLRVRLLGSDFSTEIRSATEPSVTVLSPGGLVADTYYVVVTQPTGPSGRPDLYALTVREANAF